MSDCNWSCDAQNCCPDLVSHPTTSVTLIPMDASRFQTTAQVFHEAESKVLVAAPRVLRGARAALRAVGTFQTTADVDAAANTLVHPLGVASGAPVSESRSQSAPLKPVSNRTVAPRLKQRAGPQQVIARAVESARATYPGRVEAAVSRLLSGSTFDDSSAMSDIPAAEEMLRETARGAAQAAMTAADLNILSAAEPQVAVGDKRPRVLRAMFKEANKRSRIAAAKANLKREVDSVEQPSRDDVSAKSRKGADLTKDELMQRVLGFRQLTKQEKQEDLKYLLEQGFRILGTRYSSIAQLGELGLGLKPKRQ
jgi:hypothetical protein